MSINLIKDFWTLVSVETDVGICSETFIRTIPDGCFIRIRSTSETDHSMVISETITYAPNVKVHRSIDEKGNVNLRFV